MKLYELHIYDADKSGDDTVGERSILAVLGQQEEEHNRSFYCYGQDISSLVGGPKVTVGNYLCSTNKLTSLEGGPIRVGGEFHCDDNKLTSLEGVPEFVGGVFFCGKNKLRSLKGINKQIKHIGRLASFANNPITSHVLGLLRISGLTEVVLDNVKVNKIINKHLAGDRDIFACQEELIKAGLEAFAEL